MNPLFLLAAVPIFGLMVIAHEFGHFIVAKRYGIRVEEFAIGFPPRLFGFKRGETLYSINLLPIGGFVRMPGENGEMTDEAGNPDPRSFGAKKAGPRAAVLLAGVAMNLLLAILLFTVSEALGRVEYQPVLKDVTNNSPAQAAGIKAGDRILAVNGHPVTYFSDITVDVGNAISAATATDPHVKTVPVQITVLHQGTTAPVTLTVDARNSSDPNIPPLGVEATDVGAVTIRPPLWQAPLLGVRDIGAVTVGTVQVVGKIIQGVIPVGQALSGPVGIVKTTGQVASAVPQVGISPLLFLAGFLSLNLAVFNLLPIPGLDGGRLLFIVIEVARHGKRVSPQREALVHLIGMGVLLFLVLLVTINDLSNIGR